MNIFTERLVSKRKASHRKLVNGVGLNDAEYATTIIVKGKVVMCPYYAKWHSMLKRCYSDSYQKSCPSYVGCTVINEWLVFSVFKQWMIKQNWKGMQLDKDLLDQGNKVYGPKVCIFVSYEINLLLTSNKATRGECRQGVSFYKPTEMYRASISVNGERRHLGYFNTEHNAFESYKAAKYAIIKEIALEQEEPLRSALLNYKIGAIT